MADLIAQGNDSRNRWRRTFPALDSVIVGRSGVAWAAPWDDRISRRHAELTWDGKCLLVKRLPEARNPIFFKGRISDSFEVVPGEHFVIGETTFSLTVEKINVSLNAPMPVQEQAYSTEYLRNLPFRHVGPHIDVLGRLPELIRGADSDAELSLRLVNMLLGGLPRASAAALIRRNPTELKKTKAVLSQGVLPEQGPAEIEVLHWDRRGTALGDFQPSQRLILDALQRAESVLHVWQTPLANTSSDFTINQGIDWAFCTPVGGQACEGWALYVAGRFAGARGTMEAISDPGDLRDDLKFTEVAATTLGALCDVRRLERERAGLSQFFAPPVLEALQGVDPEIALAPRETEVTVLFCDLRGFSRASERAADDLLGLLQRVSQALGVATREIRAEGGVVGDFHGDATMGFWGWPWAQKDAAHRAIRTALAIRSHFAALQQPAGPARFEVGIGIATGTAVAGKIGTVDQVKVTVFGPVVNLASRLEGMSKVFQTSILMDEATAEVLRGRLAPSEGFLRRLVVVRPYGMERPLNVHELLPAESERQNPLSDSAVTEYEHALDAFLAGQWPQALEQLQLLATHDPVAGYLASYIQQNGKTPPPNWDGVIPLVTK